MDANPEWSRAREDRTPHRSVPAQAVSASEATTLEGLRCADLVDAMGRLHRHRCHIADLVSPTPGRVLFGPAVTISYFPSCSAALDPERYNLGTGQYVFADSSGAVIIPDHQLDEVLATARRVEAEDAGFRDQIARERR